MNLDELRYKMKLVLAADDESLMSYNAHNISNYSRYLNRYAAYCIAGNGESHAGWFHMYQAFVCHQADVLIRTEFMRRRHC